MTNPPRAHIPRILLRDNGTLIAWNPAVTVERIIDGAEREMTTLDNPGFCLTCAEEAECVEPDARFYTCEYCGAETVFGASELFLYVTS